MSLNNTAQNYGSIAKTLHWLTALLFLGSYMSFYYRQWFTEDKTSENWTALQLHLSIGISIGVLVLLRIIWRFMNRQPDPEPGSRLLQLSARLGHLALYLILIIMPVTGYLGTGADTEFFFLFDIPKFPDTWLFSQLVELGLVTDFESFEAPIDYIHKELLGAWLAWLLVVGHIMAALYHHFKLRDRTLVKMTTGQNQA